jgi:hypothetical protein
MTLELAPHQPYALMTLAPSLRVVLIALHA